MSRTPDSPTTSRFQLRTLGSAALLRDGVPAALRTKDLALLIYLAGTRGHAHRRARLATLLWDGAHERSGLHSLSQAIFRLHGELGAGAIQATRHVVTLRVAIPSDVDALGEDTLVADDSVLTVPRYDGDFVADLLPGPGASDFDEWAEQRRAQYRIQGLRRLDTIGAAAEARGDWQVTLTAGLRAIEIEPLYEEGHRRVIRAWMALDEYPLALRHYERLTRALADAVDMRPSAMTRALVDHLRGRDAMQLVQV